MDARKKKPAIPPLFDIPKLSRRENRIKAAAYHESGHAVAATIFGVPFSDEAAIGIYPKNGTYYGYCRIPGLVKPGEGALLHGLEYNDEKVKDLFHRIEISMRLNLAGPIAEKWAIGSSQRFPGGNGDLCSIWMLMLEVQKLYFDLNNKCFRIVFDPYFSVEDWIDDAAREIRKIFRTPLFVWHSINTLATVLRAKQQLKAYEVTKILEDYPLSALNII